MFCYIPSDLGYSMWGKVADFTTGCSHWVLESWIYMPVLHELTVCFHLKLQVTQDAKSKSVVRSNDYLVWMGGYEHAIVIWCGIWLLKVHLGKLLTVVISKTFHVNIWLYIYLKHHLHHWFFFWFCWNDIIDHWGSTHPWLWTTKSEIFCVLSILDESPGSGRGLLPMDCLHVPSPSQTECRAGPGGEVWPLGGLAVRDGVEQWTRQAKPLALVQTVCDLDTPDKQTAPVHWWQGGTFVQR